MKQTYIDQITRADSGHLEVRMKKFTGGLNPDGTPEFRYHRTVVEPGGDVDVQMNLVNFHIATAADQQQFAQCDISDRPLLKAMQGRVPPEAVTKFKTERAEQLAQLEAAKIAEAAAARAKAEEMQRAFDVAVAAALARRGPA